MSMASESMTGQYLRKEPGKVWLDLIYTINNRIFYKNNQFILHSSEKFTTMITTFVLLQ